MIPHSKKQRTVYLKFIGCYSISTWSMGEMDQYDVEGLLLFSIFHLRKSY